MFQDRVHGHGVKGPMVERKLLHVRRDIRHGLIYLLGFQGTGMNVHADSLMACLPKQVGTPAVAASHVQDPGWTIGQMPADERDITAVVLDGVVDISPKHSTYTLGRASIECLHAHQIHRV
jgi:hypothetical protein